MTLSPRAIEAAARAIFEVSVYHGYTREFLESEWIRCKNIEIAKAKAALTAALAVDGLCLVDTAMLRDMHEALEQTEDWHDGGVGWPSTHSAV